MILLIYQPCYNIYLFCWSVLKNALKTQIQTAQGHQWQYMSMTITWSRQGREVGPRQATGPTFGSFQPAAAAALQPPETCSSAAFPAVQAE